MSRRLIWIGGQEGQDTSALASPCQGIRLKQSELPRPISTDPVEFLVAFCRFLTRGNEVALLEDPSCAIERQLRIQAARAC